MRSLCAVLALALAACSGDSDLLVEPPDNGPCAEPMAVLYGLRGAPPEQVRNDDVTPKFSRWTYPRTATVPRQTYTFRWGGSIQGCDNPPPTNL